ncbi:MAG TPA: hypothetical protein VHF51_00015 [Solirubrobacteraceae bacterium]|nr:hypothetical protein [Solirubrobacteraceae bacterium]
MKLRRAIVLGALGAVTAATGATAAGGVSIPVLSDLVGPDGKISVSAEEARDLAQRLASAPAYKPKLPKEPVSLQRCMAPTAAVQPLTHVRTRRTRTRMVSVYTIRGGYVRQTCDRRGFAKSLLATMPFRTPDGMRQLRTETITYDGPTVAHKHADYTEESIARVWDDEKVRAQLLREGDIR